MPKKDEKFDKYEVTDKYLVQGKKILIIGATGNWGSHFAAGMAMAAHADLVLVDYKDKETLLNQLVAEIEKFDIGIKVDSYLAAQDEIAKRNEFYLKMEGKFGEFAAIMDVERINIDK